MKKIKIAIITVLITMTIIYGENYIVKAAGAQDSNPHVQLPNGGLTNNPYAPGEQIQQDKEGRRKKEEGRGREKEKIFRWKKEKIYS